MKSFLKTMLTRSQDPLDDDDGFLLALGLNLISVGIILSVVAFLTIGAQV